MEDPMAIGLTRREWTAGSTAALGLWAAGPLGAQEFKTKLFRAQIVGKPNEAELQKLKDGGFDGVETTAADASVADAEAGRKIAEKVGIKIHSVMRAWMSFNSDKPAEVDGTIAKTETSLKAAQAYGADAILLVPCRLGKVKMPEPWDLKIEFDPKTLHLKRVVEGDNAPYADYIAAHDRSTDMSIKAVEKLIPVAEKTGVVIGLENVWNSLWLMPDLFAAFVGSFKNKWVKAYFDIGNHVKFAPPEQWLKALGSLVCKLHVKDFKLNADGKGGNFCKVRAGSVNWPVVRKTIEEIQYSGFMTLEADAGPTPADQVKTLDTIIAGQ
jgi:hexulose-6-phosphate isomerase